MRGDATGVESKLLCNDGKQNPDLSNWLFATQKGQIPLGASRPGPAGGLESLVTR